MKKIIVLVFAFLIYGSNGFAQPGKKLPQKDKPPSQKEMADMMNAMQKELDGMSPEEKKMMDSMGVKMPSTKIIPKVTDKQLANAWEDENRIVPKRDEIRIAAIPKKLSEAQLASYLSAIQKKAAAVLSQDGKNMGEKVYSYIQANSKNSREAGNMASALWIANKTELSIYVMGKICIADPTNTDNLSNYASMLSMLGGQHLAIPILNILNTKFPNNSTLLNNLGQAWFGLGEISKAEKYLDSAIHIYAYHPQANLTKASIEESKGNTSKAIEALKKSMMHAYTNEKEDRLRKLGYKINIRDIRLQFRPSADPLGLERFKRPDYPTSLSEMKTLKPYWENFNIECDSRLTQLGNKRKNLTEAYEKDVSNFKMRFTAPLLFTKASLQLNEIQTQYETKMKMLATQQMVLANDLNKIQQEHKKAAPEAPCDAHQEAEDDFIRKYNERKKVFDEEALKVFRHYYSELAYWSQYTSTDKKQFDLVVLGFEEDWLRKLKEYQPLLTSEYENLECIKKKKAESGKLSDFDVVACNYNDTMNLQVIAFYHNCSRMTSKLNLKFAEYTRFDDFNRAEGDTYISSTIKISVEKGFDDLKGETGPIKVEAKIGAGIELELDREGIKDVMLGVEAKIGAGWNTFDKGLEEEGSIGGKDMVDTTLELGVEGRVSLISGHGEIGGSGILRGVKITEW